MRSVFFGTSVRSVERVASAFLPDPGVVPISKVVESMTELGVFASSDFDLAGWIDQACTAKPEDESMEKCVLPESFTCCMLAARHDNAGCYVKPV